MPKVTNLVEEIPVGFRLLTDAEKATASKADFSEIMTMKGVWVKPKDKTGQLMNHDTYIVRDAVEMTVAQISAIIGRNVKVVR